MPGDTADYVISGFYDLKVATVNILADEPTGNLDSNTTESIYKLLRQINAEKKTTFIIITHDNRIAEKADRIVEIKDGRIGLDLHS